jgi:hypothetical protein
MKILLLIYLIVVTILILEAYFTKPMKDDFEN